MLLRAVALLIVVVSAISVVRRFLRMLEPSHRERGEPTGMEHLVKDPERALSAKPILLFGRVSIEIPDGKALRPLTHKDRVVADPAPPEPSPVSEASQATAKERNVSH